MTRKRKGRTGERTEHPQHSTEGPHSSAEEELSSAVSAHPVPSVTSSTESVASDGDADLELTAAPADPQTDLQDSEPSPSVEATSSAPSAGSDHSSAILQSNREPTLEEVLQPAIDTAQQLPVGTMNTDHYESVVPDGRAPFENKAVIAGDAPVTRTVSGDNRRSLRPLVLHELHWSPFCGKVRAVLRCLGLPYVEMPVDTCTHATIKHLENTHHHTPLLEDPNSAGCVIGGSTPIVTYLDSKYNHSRLFPTQAVLDMVSELDRRVGMPARRLAYARMAVLDAGMFSDLFFAYHHQYLSRIPGVRYVSGNYLALRVMQQYRLHENDKRRIAELLEDYLCGLQLKLQVNDFRALVGTTLTAADITFAELMRPLRLVPRFAKRFPQLWKFQERIIHQCNLDLQDEYSEAAERFAYRSVIHAPTDAAAIAICWARDKLSSVLPMLAFDIDTQGSSELAIHAEGDEIPVRSSEAAKRSIRPVGLLHRGVIRDLYHYWVSMRPQILSTSVQRQEKRA